MKRTTKPSYAPPTSEVVEVKFQGVLCQSGNANASMTGTFDEFNI